MLDLEKKHFTLITPAEDEQSDLGPFGLPCCLLWCFLLYPSNWPGGSCNKCTSSFPTNFFRWIWWILVSEMHCVSCIVLAPPSLGAVPSPLRRRRWRRHKRSWYSSTWRKRTPRRLGQVGLDINRIASECALWLSYSAKERCWRAIFFVIWLIQIHSIARSAWGNLKQDNLSCDWMTDDYIGHNRWHRYQKVGW